MTSLILVGASCLVLTLYLVAYMATNGIPTSISATYYRNENKWLYSAVLAASSTLALMPMMDLTSEPFHFLAFISIVSVYFVAASPAFKEEYLHSLHSLTAILLGVAIFAWLFLMADIPYLAFAGIAAGLINRRKFVFWFEVGLIYNLYYALILLLGDVLIL